MLPSEQRLSPKVKRACHAVAIDDERQTFFPLLWDESREAVNATSTNTDQERLTQVWFSGVHSNVGGGYADDGLSHQPLSWIAREAARLGLRFQKSLLVDDGDVIPTAWLERASRCAPLNDSRRGAGAFYRYHPRPIDRLCHAPDGKVNIVRPKIHRSVFERVRDGRDGYAPFALPARYAVVDAEGAILEGDADAAAPAPAPNPFEHTTQAIARERRQQAAWDVVWRRRIVYFLTVGVALLILLKPLLPWFDNTAPIADTFAPLKAIVDLLGAFLPAMADGWLDHYRRHPTHLIAGAGLLGSLLWWSRRLKSGITGRMDAIWRAQGLTAARVGPAPAPGGWIVPAANRACVHEIPAVHVRPRVAHGLRPGHGRDAVRRAPRARGLRGGESIGVALHEQRTRGLVGRRRVRTGPACDLSDDRPHAAEGP